MRETWAIFMSLAVFSAAGATAPCAFAQEGEVDFAALRQTRAEAYVSALSSGDARAFEAVADEHLSPEMLARRTPGERAQILQRIHGDFGRMEIVAVRRQEDTIRIEVRGATGMNGVFVFRYASSPEQRISAVNVEVTMGGGEQSGGPNVPAAPLSAAMSAEAMSAALEGWIAPFVSHDDFAGVVLIARDGQPFVWRAYGPADRSRGAPADTQTAYNIASIGKRFTQTAIARLIQEGRLTLETTIGDVLPDYPNSEAHSATVAQLIAMQGGIANIFGPERDREPRERFSSNHAYYDFVAAQPQRFAPGARTEYCNGCYVVLGEMIERLSGMSFEQYVERHVFIPAGMTRTGYFRTDRLPSNTAASYRRSEGPNSPYAATTHLEGLAGSGAGGLYSTAGDLLAFDNAVREGRLLDRRWSAWVLGGEQMRGRNTSPLAIEGGGVGSSASFISDGRWTVIVTANVERPLAFRIADALAAALQSGRR